MRGHAQTPPRSALCCHFVQPGFPALCFTSLNPLLSRTQMTADASTALVLLLSLNVSSYFLISPPLPFCTSPPPPQVSEDASLAKVLLKSVNVPTLGELNNQIDKLTAECNK